MLLTTMRADQEFVSTWIQGFLSAVTSGKYGRGLENYPIILQSHYLIAEESYSNEGRKQIPKMNFIIHEPIYGSVMENSKVT